MHTGDSRLHFEGIAMDNNTVTLVVHTTSRVHSGSCALSVLGDVGAAVFWCVRHCKEGLKRRRSSKRGAYEHNIPCEKPNVIYMSGLIQGNRIDSWYRRVLQYGLGRLGGFGCGLDMGAFHQVQR